MNSYMHDSKYLRRCVEVLRLVFYEFFHTPLPKQTARLAFHALLMAVFNTVELRAFLTLLGLEAHLPGREVTQEVLTVEAILLLERMDLVEDALDRLFMVRPRQRQKIECVWRLYRDERGP